RYRRHRGRGESRREHLQRPSAASPRGVSHQSGAHGSDEGSAPGARLPHDRELLPTAERRRHLGGVRPRSPASVPALCHLPEAVPPSVTLFPLSRTLRRTYCPAKVGVMNGNRCGLAIKTSTTTAYF